MTDQQWAEFVRQHEREERLRDERTGDVLVMALFLFAVAVVLLVSTLN